MSCQNWRTKYFTFPIYITPGLTWRGGLLVTGTGQCSARLNVSAEAEMSNVCVKIVCNTFLNFQLLFPPSQLFPVCFSLISPSFSGCWLPWPRPPCPGTASCGCRARGARNFWSLNMDTLIGRIITTAYILKILYTASLSAVLRT